VNVAWKLRHFYTQLDASEWQTLQKRDRQGNSSDLLPEVHSLHVYNAEVHVEGDCTNYKHMFYART